MEPVGRRNQAVVEAARLHRARHRKTEGLTLIEGPQLLAEALASGIGVTTIFISAGSESDPDPLQNREIPIAVVDPDAMKRLAGTKTPRGPIAIIEIPPSAPLRPTPTLVSWGVSDPGNVGTMIRVAAAFGWGFAHLDGSADPWSPKVLRSGAGGHFRTRISSINGAEQLRSAGLQLIATVVAGGEDPDCRGQGPYAVLIGEETAGLPAAVVAGSDHRVSIPMPGGVESLNAGVAAGIIVYALSKHIGETGRQG